MTSVTVRRASLLVAVAIAGLLGLAPAAHAASALPTCRYDDIRTRFTDLSEWHRTLLDTIYKVPRSYEPRDLRSTANAGLNGGYLVRRLVLDDLRAMARAARAAGKAVAVRSAYRSYATQKRVFRQAVADVGRDEALKVSARPGHSEHQLGTTIDFRSASSTRAPWDYPDWGKTRPGRWMRNHAWEYGFVMSYPKGKSAETCYSYEPWHYRYVGRTVASRVHARGVTLRRYLWEASEAAKQAAAKESAPTRLELPQTSTVEGADGAATPVPLAVVIGALASLAIGRRLGSAPPARR
jgi:D-alanyl-D-alanine carboxypeptidase